MANKYDVLNQIEAEKTQSKINGINSYTSLINGALQLGSEIYDVIKTNDEIAKKQKEELDAEAGKQYFLDNVYAKQYDVDNELSYNKVETKEATVLDNTSALITGQGTSPNSGAISTDIISSDQEYTFVAKTPDEKYNSISEYYINFKANHPEVFEEASEAFIKAFDDNFNSFWANKQLTMSQERITSNDAILQNNVESNAQLAIENAGTNTDYYESQLNIKYGGDLAKSHYEIPELPDISDSSYAEKKIQRDYAITKSYVYDTLTSYRGYTPELAEAYINENAVQIAMNMDYNSAKEEIAQLIRTDATFNYSLYAQAKTESFASSELIKANGLQNKLTESDKLTYMSNMSTIAKREVALFQQQIQTGSSKMFDTFTKSINNADNPLTTKTIYDAVDSFSEQLGLDSQNGREILYANMDSDTQSAFNTFLAIGQENEWKIEASEITKVINDDTLAIEYAEKNGISYTSIEDLRNQIKLAQSAGVQNYIYVNKFSSDNKATLSSSDSSVGSSSVTSTTSTVGLTSTVGATSSNQQKTPTLVPTVEDRIDEFNDTYNVQNQDELRTNDTYNGYVKQYSSRQEELDKFNLMQDTLSRIDSWIADGDTDFKELIQKAIALEESDIESELQPVSEIIKPLAEIAKKVGIDDITQIDQEQIKVLSDYISSLKTNLAKSMTSDTEYFASVGVMEKKLSEEEILNESSQRIVSDKYSNSNIGNIRKTYEVNKANSIISQGSQELVTQYSVLETLNALQKAVNDGLYDSAETEAVLSDILANNPELAQVVTEAYNIANWADSNIVLESSDDIQRVIDSIVANIDTTASTMANASSKKTKYGSTDAQQNAQEYKNIAKGDKQVTSVSRAYGETESTLKTALDEYMKNAMIYRQDSINRYEITGEKDEVFEQYRTLLTTKDAEGKDVVPSDTAVIRYMKEAQSQAKKTYPNVDIDTDGSIIANLAIYEEQATLKIRDQVIALQTYSNEFDISNIIDRQAIDNLYKSVGGTEDVDTTEKIRKISSYFAGDTQTEIQKEKEKISSQFVTELTVAKKKNNTLYTEGSNLATEWIEANKKAEEKLTADVQNSAWALLSMGKTDIEVSAILQSAYGVSEEQASSFIQSVRTLSYDNTSGIFKVDTSAFNMAFNGEDVSGLVNNMIDDFCSGLDSASKAVYSQKYGAMLMNIVRQESLKGQGANYANALANFEAEMKKTTAKTMKEMFSVASVSDYSTSDSKKDAKSKGANYSKCEWGNKYNEGQLYFTSYTSMIADAQASQYESNIKMLEILGNDTSMSTEIRTKTCTALAINTLYGSEVIKAEDLNTMSAKDMWEQAVNLAGNSLQLNTIAVLGDIYYTGSLGLQGLSKYSTDAWWIDSNFTDTSVLYTDAGYVYKCQTINGETVYAKPTFNGENVGTFTFYSDKNCIQPLYNPLGEALKGLSNEALEEQNIQTQLQQYNSSNENNSQENLLFADIEIREGDSQEEIERKMALGNTTVAYKDYTGQTRYAQLRSVQELNYFYGGVELIGSSATNKVSITTKRALGLNQQIVSTQKAYNNAPTGLTSLKISDGSLEVKHSKSYGVNNISTVDGQLCVLDYENGTKYSLGSDGELTPELTNKISDAKQKEYYIMAQEIVTRSNGQVAIADAYEAISMAMEGYDECVTVLGSNNKVYTYIPKIQQYIVAGWYL